jgi:hypothetical protein
VPDSTPKQLLDLEDLGLLEGAPVLLRQGLSSLSSGEWLEVRGDSANLDEDLPVWCRTQGLGYERRNDTPAIHRIQKGAARPILHSPSEVVESANPSWGLAPRGATVEAGGPQFAFPLKHKRDVWAENLSSIYRQAVANQWSAARDIPWTQLPKVPVELERAVAQIMTFLTENEFAALYVPARFIPRIHPHYREVVEVMAMQVVDEARHAETFTRRAQASGSELGTTATSGQLSLQTLLEEPDFTTATFLLNVMGEGTFLTLLKFIQDHAPDPVTRDLAGLAHRDEARHVAFGTEHIRYVLQIEPNRRQSLAAAVERRSQVLASVSGLSPYVSDALVVLAGGGVSIAQIREGARRVLALHREMDASRRDRLQSLGFTSNEASALSAYHTKNFM